MLPLSGNVSTNTSIGIYIELMLEAMFMHKKIEFQYTEINDKMQKEAAGNDKRKITSHIVETCNGLRGNRNGDGVR